MEFWLMSPPSSTKDLADCDQKVTYGEPIICPADPGHRRAGKRSSNLSLILPGQSFKDIIWTWLTECVVTDPVLQRFIQKGFTGLETRPAQGKLRTRSQSVRLHELVITGWGGMAAPTSGIRLIEECKLCARNIYSVYTNPSLIFDPSKWDGSDFFVVWPLPRYIFVTERVREAIIDAGFKGAIFQKLSDLKTGFSDTLTPGRLSDWMPLERAKLLGDTLDAEGSTKH